MTTTTKARKGGLDWTVPDSGRAADACQVALTTAFLIHAGRKPMHHPGAAVPIPARTSYNESARHAARLHVISGLLHRLDERACNEDLTCPKCGGEGHAATYRPDIHGPNDSRVCRACAGRGRTTGRREASLEADAREIASHYGLTCYFQGDPRGCSLYLIDPNMIPADLKVRPEARQRDMDDARRDWIDSNYTRGHAVSRLGS